ncbi:MAG: alpha-ribazole phosphatase, partial [Cellvibrio sp.]|uniref:alpha-ribazole phosphatase n=1 Tax=Cellvibrio sp. TaxID=1965322 RepID=UPI00271E3E10|nr:alpha-ribazole phosphatase [Cellvibrio sp.]
PLLGPSLRSPLPEGEEAIDAFRGLHILVQTLYLIRHTRPDIAPGLCYGQLDVGLSGSFVEEANHVLNWLPKLDLIISSPLLRTRKLAEFLALMQHCKVRIDTRLMEKNFGVWEGRAWDDIARHEIDAWTSDVMGYAPTGGESAQQVMLRVQAFLQELTRLPQQNIALVAHGGSIRAILAQLASIPLIDTLNWKIDYGAVIAVRIGRK